MIEVLSARAFWCASDEKILWCHPIAPVSTHYVLYQVPGLDEWGDKRWTAGKVLGGIASGVVGTAMEVLSPTEGDSYNTPSVQQAVVSGRDRDCLAASHLGHWQASGVNTKGGSREFVWVLTSHRLGMLEFAKGKSDDAGLLGGLKKKIGGSAGQDDAGGRHRSVQLPGLVVHAEFPRNIISNIDVAQYKVKGQAGKYLRVTLADGSAIDLTFPGNGSHGGHKIDRLLAMSFGRE
ncbi:hypothetical protein SAMN05216215_105368 [Saccharopolyspora shandongensis]|uniref:Uncharacterized protein n=1 Tax=Saccharopolyspora shandongensis TaxID=418495 RepID=A0A1H3RF39_9PSEU|nr:hypothetical protein [Saccharopolyspora shandongensis]SDZ23881.1 hypothetical protein SAMN05216215_105368 [Saccharopolyspora shandongensis]